MLTKKKLIDMEPDSIFARGTCVDSPDGINMVGSGRKLRWIAKRRSGPFDWCIYIHWEEHSDYYIKRHGDKVTSEQNIKKLVPCDDEAFKLYGY